MKGKRGDGPDDGDAVVGEADGAGDMVKLVDEVGRSCRPA
jgi:hypothetical protein